jgi:GTPase SAR1 family protein
MAFFPTSAKTGFNVNEAFEELVRQVVMLRDTDMLA